MVRAGSDLEPDVPRLDANLVRIGDELCEAAQYEVVARNFVGEKGLWWYLYVSAFPLYF